MRGYKFLLLILIPMGFFSCKQNGEDMIIGKHNLVLQTDILTPEILWSFGRLGDAHLSPDGESVVYGVTYYSIPENKSNREIFVVNTDGSNNRQITTTGKSEHGAKWIKGGKKLAFLSSESGSMQLWEMNPDGTNRMQISNREGGIIDFMYAPDDGRILFIANVKYGTTIADKYPDLKEATGILVNDLMYKHWDEWTTEIPHPFLVDYEEGKLTNECDILNGEPYECPLKPFGGIEQLAFSPNGEKIAYTCRKKEGLAYSISTNSDIYLYDIATQTTVNLTEGMMGYDTNPMFSRDGQRLAWLSMEHDGYESDKNRLFVLDFSTNQKSDVSEYFDQNTESFDWSEDGEHIYLTSCQHGTTQIYKANIFSKEIQPITTGYHDYESVLFSKKGLIAVKHSLSMPNEIYRISESDGSEQQITFENQHLLDQLTMGKVEERWIETTDKKKMLTWVVYPPHFDSSKKYPALLYCQGGPQSAVSQFWSFRWNLQIMAANGYIVVAPNRRGLPGFGSKWNEEISGDYGGQCMKDYFSAIDAVKKEPFIDSEKLGCVGASFGGYSVYWLAGNHEKRFKAFIAHDGIFNMEQQYLETDEMWFANWDMGGAYWEKENAVAQRTFSNSPHKFVDKWDTPILCIHGEKDYRILASQGMSAFNAAILRGIPAQLLVFPDENHWVLKPQNGILWQRTFFDFLDKWLKK